jgi:hypothetical protein
MELGSKVSGGAAIMADSTRKAVATPCHPQNVQQLFFDSRNQ